MSCKKPRILILSIKKCLKTFNYETKQTNIGLKVVQCFK